MARSAFITEHNTYTNVLQKVQVVYDGVHAAVDSNGFPRGRPMGPGGVDNTPQLLQGKGLSENFENSN